MFGMPLPSTHPLLHHYGLIIKAGFSGCVRCFALLYSTGNNVFAVWAVFCKCGGVCSESVTDRMLTLQRHGNKQSPRGPCGSSRSLGHHPDSCLHSCWNGPGRVFLEKLSTLVCVRPKLIMRYCLLSKKHDAAAAFTMSSSEYSTMVVKIRVWNEALRHCQLENVRKINGHEGRCRTLFWIEFERVFSSDALLSHFICRSWQSERRLRDWPSTKKVWLI